MTHMIAAAREVLLGLLDGMAFNAHAVDVRGLRQAMQRSGLYLRLPQKFVAGRDAFSTQYAAALAAADRPTLQRLVHTLKGSAAQLGAMMADDNFGTRVYFDAHAAILRATLGERFANLQTAIENFEFERAAACLAEAALQPHASGKVHRSP